MFKQRIVFVHGAGPFGAVAWPRQHGMALKYDALFLRRHGFDPVAEPLDSSFDADTAIVLRSLADDGRGAAGGHVVAHAEGAISAMMAAVQRPDLVYSLTLVEPACLSLTAELPATAAHRSLMQPLFDVRHQLGDEDFQREGLPKPLRPFVEKCFGLSSNPLRLSQIRTERRRGSSYASLRQCGFELRSAEQLYVSHRIPYLNSASVSVEEMAATILQRMNLKH